MHLLSAYGDENNKNLLPTYMPPLGELVLLFEVSMGHIGIYACISWFIDQFIGAAYTDRFIYIFFCRDTTSSGGFGENEHAK